MSLSHTQECTRGISKRNGFNKAMKFPCYGRGPPFPIEMGTICPFREEQSRKLMAQLEPVTLACEKRDLTQCCPGARWEPDNLVAHMEEGALNNSTVN